VQPPSPEELQLFGRLLQSGIALFAFTVHCLQDDAASLISSDPAQGRKREGAVMSSTGSRRSIASICACEKYTERSRENLYCVVSVMSRPAVLVLYQEYATQILVWDFVGKSDIYFCLSTNPCPKEAHPT
jgi:hypothetical protein